MAEGEVFLAQLDRDIIHKALDSFAFLDPVEVPRYAPYKRLEEQLKGIMFFGVVPLSAVDRSTRHDTLLLKMMASEDVDNNDAEWSVPDVIALLQPITHQGLCPILHTDVIRRPLRTPDGQVMTWLSTANAEGIGHYYTIPGYHGRNGSLSDVNNLGWTGNLPEAFIWYIFYQIAETLAFLHRGLRTPAQPANPAGAVALRSKDLLKGTDASLTGASVSAATPTSAYIDVQIEDYARAMSRATFKPTVYYDQNLTWNIDDFQAAMDKDVMAMGALIHHLQHQCELNSKQQCSCSKKLKQKYSDELNDFTVGAATAFEHQSTESIATAIRPIALRWKANHWDLTMSPQVAERFEDLAAEFTELWPPALDQVKE